MNAVDTNILIYVTETGNPWLDKFGWFKDDPTFDDLQAEIAADRQDSDREMEPDGVTL